MSDGDKNRAELSGRARRLFLEEERAREGAQRVAEEKRRHDQMVAKTARLRELRLAKEAAERRSAAKPRSRKAAPK